MRKLLLILLALGLSGPASAKCHNESDWVAITGQLRYLPHLSSTRGLRFFGWNCQRRYASSIPLIRSAR
jgi:hypothetical protein